MALNIKEKQAMAESKVVQYYKSCVCELEEKNRVLEAEIQILKDMNIKYSTELVTYKDRVDILERRENDLRAAAKQATEKFEEAHRNMVAAQAVERAKLEEEYGKEK